MSTCWSIKHLGKLVLVLIGIGCIVSSSVVAATPDQIAGQHVAAGFYSIGLLLTTNSQGRVTKVIILKTSGNKMVDYWSVKHSYKRQEPPSRTINRRLEYHLK